MTAEIDRAIRKVDLGLNPVSDGKTLKGLDFQDLAVADGVGFQIFRMARSISSCATRR